MNKVVNINLSGLVFSIDEQAYEQLKSYLDGLKRHFAGTEGAAEIISDIESRIAELLQARLTDRQTVVQSEDIKEVIALMGNPNQIDGEDEEKQKQRSQQSFSNASPNDQHTIKKLRRDPYHKTLGGVCAGLANYFGVDMIIPRIVFLIAFFGYGAGLLLYVILWLVIPEASASEASQDMPSGAVKRLFRNPDDRTIGGVCSGVAEYLGIDAVWLRIAFLVAFFIFGTGFLVYIILWIAVPMAHTSAEKLQMKGYPVDVSNIERTVRDNISRSPQNKVTDGLSTVLGGLLRFTGKVIGAGFLILSILVIGGLVFLWNYSVGEMLETLDVTSIYGYLKYGFGLFSVSIAALILLTGMKLMFHTRLKVKVLSLVLITTMIVGIGLMLSFALQYKQSVADKEIIKENVITAACPDTLYIQASPQVNEEDMEEISIRWNGRRGENKYKIGYLDNLIKIYNTRLLIKPGKTDSLQLFIIKSARGESEQAARANARNIDFNASLEGNVLTIDRGILMDSNSTFKFQKVIARLRVPAGTIIKVDKHIMKMINNDFEEDFDMGETFRMTEQSLRCLDCVDTEDEDDEDMNIEWNMDEEDGDVHIHIGKDKDEVTVEANIDSTGRGSKVEVKRVGPVTIEKEVNEK